MATLVDEHIPQGCPHFPVENKQRATSNKRSHHDDASTTSRKKPNLGLSPAQYATQAVQEIHARMLNSMRKKYQVEMLSVISSSSIHGRVESTIRHLSRFHPTDMTVLPGVVLLYARASCATKLLSIAEIAKRRVHQMDQKWYQYNRLRQIQVCMPPEEIARLEAADADDNDGKTEDEEVDTFEPFATPDFSKIPDSARRPHLFFSMFLSRIPIQEFAGDVEYTMQTNAEELERERSYEAGLLHDDYSLR